MIIPQSANVLFPAQFEFYRQILVAAFGSVAMICLLLPVVSIYFMHDHRHLFKAGVNAAAAMIGTAVIMLGLGCMSDLMLTRQERGLKELEEPMGAVCRDNGLFKKIFSEYTRYMHRQLSTLPPVAAPPITHTAVGERVFIAMVKFSPYAAIEEAIKQGADVNAVDANGWTPLMLACRYRNLDVIALLLRHGAKTETWCPPLPYQARPDSLSGIDALMTAAFYNPDPAVIRLLVKHGADPNREAKNGYGHGRNGNETFLCGRMTPLMFAAKNNNSAVIQALLDVGAKVKTEKNCWLGSILKIACLYDSDLQVALLLKQHGAEFSVNDQMAFSITSGGGLDHETMAKVCRRLKYAIAVGFDPATRDNNGMTVLDHAKNTPGLKHKNVVRKMQEIIAAGAIGNKSTKP